MQSSFSSTKLSREEFRRQKDLDAARKAGTAPAEVGEDGVVINPHVPDYMSKAPWYLDTGKRSLKHQAKPDKGERRIGIDEWYERGRRTSGGEGSKATKYRKGACENCGAITHPTRECLERPRKKGAKYTGKDIAPDEVVTDFAGKTMDFAAKRDRWNGYDPAEHGRVMEEWEAVEEERRRRREEMVDAQGQGVERDGAALAKKKKKGKNKKDSAAAAHDSDFSSSDSDEAEQDDSQYAESANMAGQKVDTDNRMSIRNLRIREDRAKYLYNLDPNSAYYDPKTRSMREAASAAGSGSGSGFAGDNATRNKGDSVAMQRLQLFAWQAEARGNDLHLQANPTVNERQFREFQEKKDKLRESTRGSILDRYGGAEHFDSVPREVREGQSERYVEYSRSGRVIKGQERAKVKSRFEEDVWDNNHTSVWGSWYDLGQGKWGYKCCCSTVANSYCTGEAGREAAKAAQALHDDDDKHHRRSRSSRHRHRHSRSRSRSRSPRGYKSRKHLGEGDVSSRLDRKKLARALEDEERRLRREKETGEERAKRDEAKPDWLKEAEAINRGGAGKGRGGGEAETEVSEEQMEAYRLKRTNAYEDPMANYRDDEAV
ncbi:hypothetical protein BDZ90DRAFT_241034 [Jaminaea rosea]|uniref:Pre-mRNA-splicing factor SLU7 n=1 Tax=Jaminaea rosea TaxID=1569628 RepID=A0A316UPM8_9BASI|nr:hypothetical protein BDZ90DRAFT_241034 [Jaminaea rosea]PWN27256.1 hypothetical protein BDZ90DRAFT_241034 [Jaminaea rosea]